MICSALVGGSEARPADRSRGRRRLPDHSRPSTSSQVTASASAGGSPGWGRSVRESPSSRSEFPSAGKDLGPCDPVEAFRVARHRMLCDRLWSIGPRPPRPRSPRVTGIHHHCRIPGRSETGSHLGTRLPDCSTGLVPASPCFEAGEAQRWSRCRRACLGKLPRGQIQAGLVHRFSVRSQHFSQM